MEATPEAEEQWTDHVAKMYGMMLMRKAKGWFTGYNSNVDGHEHGRSATSSTTAAPRSIRRRSAGWRQPGIEGSSSGEVAPAR